MADIRINALATTAASTASDDFVAVDGSANGTRKLNAFSPTFGGNLTVSGGTIGTAASTNLTLAGGSSGASLVLGQGATAANATLSATGTGRVVTTPVLQIGSVYNVAGTLNTLATVGTLTLSDNVGFNLSNADGTRNLRASLFLDATNYRYGLQSVYSSASDFRFVIRQSGVDQLQVTQPGNLLIGTTTDGGQKLQVNGAGYFAGAVTATGNIRAASGTYGTFAANALTIGDENYGWYVNSGYLTTRGNNGWIFRNSTDSADAAYILNNGTFYAAGNATFAGTVIAPAATASLAPLRIPHGTAPTSPTDGDMWTTTAGLYVRINGVTVGPLS